MGCRKISTSPPDQAANSADAVNTLSESEKKGQIVKENSGVGKRKNSILGSKSKRIRVENEGTLELNVTFAQAQELLRSSPNNVPTIVVIEGIEIEEYEDAPIIGRPSIFATEHTGGEIQWAQCESCFKWRKVPASALLPAQWTCSANTWDPERSACSAAQELRSEQLQDLLPNLLSTNKPSKKTKIAKDDPDSTELDALANLAIQDGEEASMPSSFSSPLATTTTSAITTTKHPRHRPGCSCIVCIQPPSGKGPKHKQSCMCNVCETVKRRFRTQMINRVKKQSEMLGGQNRKESFGSPFKGNFDLNIRPEREEELSPGSDSGSPPTRLLTNGTETCVAQRRCSSLLANPDENGGNCQGATAEHRANALASTSATR